MIPGKQVALRKVVTGSVIFNAVGTTRPYAQCLQGWQGDWGAVPPRALRLRELVTTRDRLNLAVLLAQDSTYYDDLFAHVVQWDGVLYLEDGLHRALRAALQQRTVMHARVLVLTAESGRGALTERGRGVRLHTTTGAGGMAGYRAEKNSRSIDGLAGS